MSNNAIIEQNDITEVLFKLDFHNDFGEDSTTSLEIFSIASSKGSQSSGSVIAIASFSLSKFCPE